MGGVLFISDRHFVCLLGGNGVTRGASSILVALCAAADGQPQATVTTGQLPISGRGFWGCGPRASHGKPSSGDV